MEFGGLNPGKCLETVLKCLREPCVVVLITLVPNLEVNYPPE